MTKTEAIALIKKIDNDQFVPRGELLNRFVDLIAKNNYSFSQLRDLYGFCNCNITKTAKRVVEIENNPNLTMDLMIDDLEARARRGC